MAGRGLLGPQALKALEATRPDLIMVDLTLWDESGLDLLRALPRGASAPKVLIHTGTHSPATAAGLTTAAWKIVAVPYPTR